MHAAYTLHNTSSKPPPLSFYFLMLPICCLNAAKTLLTDCPPVKMKCYPLEKIQEWIEQHLSDDAHNEKLVLGDANVEEYRSKRNKLLGKGLQQEKPAKKPEKKRKRIEPKGIVWLRNKIM